MFDELKTLVTILQKKTDDTAVPEKLPTSRLVAEVAFCSLSEDMIRQQSEQLAMAVAEMDRRSDSGEEAQLVRKAVVLLEGIPAMHKRCADELDHRVPRFKVGEP